MSGFSGIRGILPGERAPIWPAYPSGIEIA
jgi:hypothetical protein